MFKAKAAVKLQETAPACAATLVITIQKLHPGFHDPTHTLSFALGPE